MFKRSKLAKFDASLIPVIELLQLWLSRSKVSVLTQFMFDKNYVLLTGAQLDDVCEWVYELRTKFNTGKHLIFQEVEDTPVVVKSLGSDSRTEDNNKVIIFFLFSYPPFCLFC